MVAEGFRGDRRQTGSGRPSVGLSIAVLARRRRPSSAVIVGQRLGILLVMDPMTVQGLEKALVILYDEVDEDPERVLAIVTAMVAEVFGGF
jgi:hypothetical protein